MKTTTILSIIFSLATVLTLSSCAFFSKKADNSEVVNKYENKMRLIASSSGVQLRLPPGYKADLVGSGGNVILFYKDEEKEEIIIQECKDYSVINNRARCQSKSQPIRVDVAKFKNKLKSALKVPHNFNTLGGIREIEASQKYLDKVQRKVSQVEAFIEAYGEKNAIASELLTLKKRLEEAEKGGIFINNSINKLVDNVIGNSKMKTASYSKNNTDIVYSILRTYVRPYLVEAVFVPIKTGAVLNGAIIVNGFEIAATEVTQLEWVIVMGSNPSYFQEESHCPGSYMEIDGVSLCSDFPVERVSWNDVESYISEYNERVKDNYLYSLPTDSQWKIAADKYVINDSLNHSAWLFKNSGRQTRAVAACSGSKGPPFRFKRATLPFQKGHPSVSEGPPFRFRRATLPFQKGHLSGNSGMVFYLFKKRALGV